MVYEHFVLFVGIRTLLEILLNVDIGWYKVKVSLIGGYYRLIPQLIITSGFAPRDLWRT